MENTLCFPGSDPRHPHAAKSAHAGAGAHGREAGFPFDLTRPCCSSAGNEPRQKQKKQKQAGSAGMSKARPIERGNARSDRVRHRPRDVMRSDILDFHDLIPASDVAGLQHTE